MIAGRLAFRRRVSDTLKQSGVGILGAGSLADAVSEEFGHRSIRVARFIDVANVSGVQALVIASDVDADNVEAALLAKRRMPTLRIVVRVFDPILEDYLESTAPDIKVLSMSAVAAPAILESLTSGYDASFRGGVVGVKSGLRSSATRVRSSHASRYRVVCDRICAGSRLAFCTQT
jgi:TrkA-N domain